MARAVNAFTSKLRRWLGAKPSVQVVRKVKRVPPRLAVEPLEDRVVPAVDYRAMATGLTTQLDNLSVAVRTAVNQSTAVLPILGDSLANQAAKVETTVQDIRKAINPILRGLDGNADELSIKDALIASGVVRDLSGDISDDADTTVDRDDVIISNFNRTAGTITITMKVGTNVELKGKDYKFDLGLPGVPLGITGNSKLSVNLDVEYDRISIGMQGGSFFFTSPQNRTNTLTIEVAALANNSNLIGTIGFFEVKGSRVKLPNGLPGNLPTAEVSAALVLNANGLSLTSPRLQGSAAVNMELDATLKSNRTGMTFPHMMADFHMSWNLGGSNITNRDSLGTKPTVAFNNIRFGLGSFLGSMVKPIAEKVKAITIPMAPVYELMAAPIPGLTELSEAIGGDPITLDSLAALAESSGLLPPDYQLLASLGVNLHTLVALIRQADFGPNNDVLIPVGSFDLSGESDLRTKKLNGGFTTLKQWAEAGFNNLSLKNLTDLAPVATSALESVQRKIDTGNLPPLARDAVQATFKHIKEQLRKLENNIGLSFPLLEDPVSIYKLLLGQDVDFARFDAKFFGTASQEEKIKVWGPIQAGFEGTVQLESELHAGVDTFGIRTFFMDIVAGRPADPEKLDDGLWVDSSKELVRVHGNITAQAGVDISFGTGLEFFAFAGLSGQAAGNVVVSLIDPSGSPDNRFRVLKTGEVGDALFHVQGGFSAEFNFVVEAGVRVDLIFDEVEKKFKVFEMNLARVELIDTGSISTANPFRENTRLNNKVDVIFDVNFEDGANDGRFDTIEAEVYDSILYLSFNGVVTDQYEVRNVNSLRIIGSDDNDEISVLGAMKDVRVDGGGGRDTLEMDDAERVTGYDPVYKIGNGYVSRGRSIAQNSAVDKRVDYTNMESLYIGGSRTRRNTFVVYAVPVFTILSGGDANDTYYLGLYKGTVDGLLNNLIVSGGAGFDRVRLDDYKDDRRAGYTIGHEGVARSTYVSFFSTYLNQWLSYEDSYQYLEHYGIDHVEVNGSAHGNTFIVDDRPDPRLETPPDPLSIELNTGTGLDTVQVLATTSNLTIDGQGGNDAVTIGSSHVGTRDLYGDITVSNAGGFTTLRVDDSAGTKSRDILMDTANNERGLIYGFTGTAIGGFGQSRITYRVADLDRLIVTTGSGVNTVSVADTGRVGDGGAMPTTLTTGSGLNSVYVRGTSGNLTINGGGPLTGVVIGALPGDSGNLARINASVSVLGWVSGLTITDSGSNARQMIYTLESGRFIRTDGRTGASNGIVGFSQLWMTSFDVVMGNGGNTSFIDGTPAVRSGFNSGVSVFTGNGNDLAFVRGTSGPLSLNLGAGASQVVAVGDATHSLDAIRGPLSVTGGGFIEAVVSNAASTRQQHTYITANTSAFGNSQTIQRDEYVEDHWETLNTITFSFLNPSRLTYNAGQAGDVIFVRGTLLNTPTTVNGGAGADLIFVEADNRPLLAPVHVNGTRAHGDLAFYGDYYTTTPQSYFIDRAQGKTRVARSNSADVYYSGIFQLTTVTARNGGNQISVREVPADLSLYMSVANNDAVTMGRPTSIRGFIGGDMNPIQGIVAMAGGRNVSVVMDDVNGQSGRNAVLRPDPDGYGDSITGMGPGEIRLLLDSSASVDIRGGRFNDAYSIEGILKQAISIDGGAGVNTLSYANYEDNASGPGSWYRGEFDFTDAVGGHHGTGVNGAGFAEAGISGGAFSFDGIDDYIEIPHHSDLAPSALTLEARISPVGSSLDFNRVIVSKYDDNEPSGANKSWTLSVFEGRILFGVYQGSNGRVIQTNATVSTEGFWQHIAATFDPATGDMKIYFDGQEMGTSFLDDSEVTAINIGDSPVRIGAQVSDVLGGYFSGRIDDVRIHSRVLSQAEVQSNSDAGNDGPSSGSPQGVRVHLPVGTATGLDGGISRIQNVIGSAYDDILIGNGGNVLTGGAGRDFLVAGRTPSTLNGGDGDDVLIGGFLYADDDDGELDAAAIEAIAREWFRRDVDYSARANTMRDMLANPLIRNGGANRLFGDDDSDFFVAKAEDVTDRGDGEEYFSV